MQKKSERPIDIRPASLLRFIGYQIVWWLLVYSAKLEEISQIWQLSNLMALIVSILSLNVVLNRKPNTLPRRRLALLALLGYTIDSIWVTMGYIATKPTIEVANGLMLAPPWLFAIWISFAAICMTSVSLESKSLFNARIKAFATLAALIAAGAIGGPLSYMVGEPIGVLTLRHRPLSTALLAIEWAIMFPVLLVAAWAVRANDFKNK